MASRIPEIVLVHNTQREQQTKDQLMRLFEQHTLDKWLYTEHIQIEEQAIPHSHPVLTLNTRHPDDPQALLATYMVVSAKSGQVLRRRVSNRREA
jgi:hypothetical protein